MAEPMQDFTEALDRMLLAWAKEDLHARAEAVRHFREMTQQEQPISIEWRMTQR